MSTASDRWNAVLAWATFLLALSSLVGLGFMWLDRTHAKLTVRPYLDLESILSMNSDQTAVLIANDGLGPALVGWAEWRYQGASSGDRHLNGWAKIRDYIYGNKDYDVLPRFDVKPITVEAFEKGEAIPPAQQRLLLGYPTKAETRPVRDTFHRLLDRLEYSICYCSVYGDCWLLTTTPGYGSNAYRSTVAVNDCDSIRPESLGSERFASPTLDELGTGVLNDPSSPEASSSASGGGEP